MVTVFGFTDPLLALEHFMLNSKGYFLVISDVRMSAMSGFQFIKNKRNISIN
jgi:CheY-like chemotaxis protein